MTEAQISEIIGKALFERQRERTLESPMRTALPLWRDLEESAKVYWRKDGAATIAAIKETGLAIVPADASTGLAERIKAWLESAPHRQTELDQLGSYDSGK